MKGKYKESIKDIEWILQNGAFEPATRTLYESLGINYARLKDFDKAEEYLEKSSRDKKQDDDGYLYMWLGYIHLVKQRHGEALNCFLKARQWSEKPFNKWLMDHKYHKYIQEQIESLEDEIIKAKYKDIITNN